MELEMHPRKPVFTYEIAHESGLLSESMEPVGKQEVEFGVAYNCNQCGSCCKLEWDIDVGTDDLSRWISLQLGAVLLYVCFNPKWMASLSPARKLSPPLMMIDNGYDTLFWGWPTRPACRFLIHKGGTVYCGIHRVKPSICKLYPFFWKEDGLLRVRGSQFGVCCGVTDYFRNLSEKTGTPPELLAGTPRKLKQMLDNTRATKRARQLSQRML
jgi:Fe-S-cluster containining protein